jgi:hypothetical protein
MGKLDIVLQGFYGVSPPIKGVMYCLVERCGPSGYYSHERPLPQNHECVVVQDALGDYYYHYDFSQGGDEFVAKFRTPRGTTAEDFVKNYFRGAVKDVDMDQILPGCRSNYDDLVKEQRELAKLRDKDQSCCACCKLVASGTKSKSKYVVE